MLCPPVSCQSRALSTTSSWASCFSYTADQASTGLFTRLESLAGPSMVSDSPVSAEIAIYEAFVVMGETRWGSSALLARRKGTIEIIPSSSLQAFLHIPFLPRKAMKITATLFPQSQQRLNKSQFVQKLSCQKPYRDQARLSSLVNTQVDQASAENNRLSTSMDSLSRRPASSY